MKRALRGNSAISPRLATAMLLIALLAPALLVIACNRDVAPAVASWVGSYRAVLTLPGGELPFALELAQEPSGPVAYLINGAERVRVAEVAIRGGTVEMKMPGFENQISAQRKGDALSGTLTMVKSGGRNQAIPFAATRNQSYRFFPQALAPGGDIAGRWAVTFSDDDGGESIAVGEFQQQGSAVTGTFLAPDGDHRFLAGEMREGALYLSNFSGGQAYLYHGRLAADGTLSGDYWSGLRSHQRFMARRDATASLGNTTSITALREPRAKFDFSFPDLKGKPVALSDPDFMGKVVVVTIAGSWCPNCHDEAAFLAPYYRAHHDEGLEMLGLMFEQFEDFAAAADAVGRYQREYDIGFGLLIAGITDNNDAAKKLPQLNGFYGYPTTIFIDRKGQVRRIHTGFSGPATGEHYTQLTREFDQIIRELLAEKG